MVANATQIVIQVNGRKFVIDMGRVDNALKEVDKTTSKVRKRFLGLQRPTLILSKRFGVLRLAGLGLVGALVGITAIALVSFVKSSAVAFLEFERAMNRVAAISGATEKQWIELQEVALELGRTTVFTATQSAKAMEFLALAGLKTLDIMKALPTVLNLAAAGGLELARSADIVTNVMAGMNLTVNELSKAADVLTATFTNSNTSLTQLGSAFSFIGPVAVSAGISFEEVSAAIGLLGNAGIKGTRAGTNLRTAFSRLLKPTTAVTKTLKRLSIEITTSSGALLPFSEIIGQLGRSGAKTADIMEIFGLRAGPGMLALISKGEKALRDFTRALEDSGDIAEKVAERQLRGLTGAVVAMQSAWDTFKTEFGKAIGPVLTELANKLKNIINNVRDIIEAINGFKTVATANLGAIQTSSEALNREFASLGKTAINFGVFTSKGMAIARRGAQDLINVIKIRLARALADLPVKELENVVKPFLKIQLSIVKASIATLKSRTVLSDVDARDLIILRKQKSEISIQLELVRRQIKFSRAQNRLLEDRERLERESRRNAEAINRRVEGDEARRRELLMGRFKLVNDFIKKGRDITPKIDFARFTASFESLVVLSEQIGGKIGKALQEKVNEKLVEMREEFKGIGILENILKTKEGLTEFTIAVERMADQAGVSFEIMAERIKLSAALSTAAGQAVAAAGGAVVGTLIDQAIAGRLSGKAIAKAALEAASGVLKSIAIQATSKAVFALAEGFFLASIGLASQSALAFKAAAFYGKVAVGAAVGAVVTGRAAAAINVPDRDRAAVGFGPGGGVVTGQRGPGIFEAPPARRGRGDLNVQITVEGFVGDEGALASKIGEIIREGVFDDVDFALNVRR